MTVAALRCPKDGANLRPDGGCNPCDVRREYGRPDPAPAISSTVKAAELAATISNAPRFVMPPPEIADPEGYAEGRYGPPDEESPDADAPKRGRRIDLGPWLDGTYVPPQPTVGGCRSDSVCMLYPSRWHTVIALTTAGKSWLGLWHAAGELNAGNFVVYLHFEEADPGGTLERLRMLGVDTEIVRERFHWLDCGERWEAGDFAAELEGMPTKPTLVVLDGINAACTQHGWKPNDPDAVGNYRSRFVSPATRRGAAVVSLGHPPKARDRQDERHGYGATGWLDEVDGVGFRLVASKEEPIGRGRKGHSSLYVVKDRPGQVERNGRIDTGKEAGWNYFGLLEMDNSTEDVATVVLRAPSGDGQTAPDQVDRLADRIVYYLVRHGGRFESKTRLAETLRAGKVDFANDDLAPALMRLKAQNRIEWPEVGAGKTRPGWVLSDDDWSGSVDAA